MERIKIMINGLPGNVTNIITQQAMADNRFQVLPYALTGPEIENNHCLIDETEFELIKPAARQAKIEAIRAAEGEFIAVDFTHPSAVNANAEFYCSNQMHFIMGTTGGDRDRLAETVRNSSIAAVIAPNMSKQIVGFQAMMAYAAERFPNLFKGYTLTLRESHQAGKADTSGTAKAMVRYFNCMGVEFTTDQIEKERDPERQRNMWGVPPAYLDGHGWHTYTLLSSDQNAKFEFVHNINGRDIYGEGTMDAILFLHRKIKQGAHGVIYSMIDVLEDGGAD